MADMTYDEICKRVDELEDKFESDLRELPGVDYALAVRCADPLTDDEQGSTTITEDNEVAAQLIEGLFATVREEDMPLDDYVDFGLDVLINIGINEPGFLEKLQEKLPEVIKSVNEQLAEPDEAEEDE